MFLYKAITSDHDGRNKGKTNEFQKCEIKFDSFF